MESSKIGIIAGGGLLPQIIIKDLEKNNIEFSIICFEDFLIKKYKKYTNFFAKYEKISFLLDYLNKKKIKKLIFVGYFNRPNIEIKNFDDRSLNFLLPAIQNLNGGDNNLFKSIIKIFENYGFIVLDPFYYSPKLLEGENNLTLKKPSKKNIKDASIAYEFFKSFSLLDIGQSLVISEGMCLAVETLPGTDKMLDFVKDFRKNSVSNFSSSGILFKSKKFNQETKIDMPVVGPNTVKKVKDAKLDGIVLEENSVIIIDKKLSIKLANDFNIFICSIDFKKLNKYYE